MAPLTTKRLSHTPTENATEILARVLHAVVSWLARSAASASGALWHGTGLDHLVYTMLHVLEILLIAAGVILLAPWVVFLAYKLVVWLCTGLARLVSGMVLCVGVLILWLQDSRHAPKVAHQQPAERASLVVHVPIHGHRDDGFNRVTAWLLATNDVGPPMRFGYNTFGDDRVGSRPPAYASHGYRPLTPETTVWSPTRPPQAATAAAPELAAGRWRTLSAQSSSSSSTAPPPYTPVALDAGPREVDS